jgi:ADP-ribosylglycohydrolase
MEMVHEDASLTHHDPLAGHVAAAGALVLRGLIKGLDWLETLAWARMSGGPELARWLQPPDNPAQPDGFAPNVLRAAVYFVGRSGSLDEALRNSMAFAGPANYAPVVVGTFGGARWGLPAESSVLMLPKDMRNKMAGLATALTRETAD